MADVTSPTTYFGCNDDDKEEDSQETIAYFTKHHSFIPLSTLTYRELVLSIEQTYALDLIPRFLYANRTAASHSTASSRVCWVFNSVRRIVRGKEVVVVILVESGLPVVPRGLPLRMAALLLLVDLPLLLILLLPYPLLPLSPPPHLFLHHLHHPYTPTSAIVFPKYPTPNLTSSRPNSSPRNSNPDLRCLHRNEAPVGETSAWIVVHPLAMGGSGAYSAKEGMDDLCCHLRSLG